MAVGTIKTVKYSEGVSVTAPTPSTGEKIIYDDSANWDGSTSSVTYTVDGSGSGTGSISDARKAKFYLLDPNNNYKDMGGTWEAISQTQVKVTFEYNLANQTFRLMGLF